MNIALIRKRFVFHGGAERYVTSLIEQLEKRGHTLTLFANKWTPYPKLQFIKIPTIKIVSFFSVVSFAFFSFLKIKKHRTEFDIVHSFEKTCFQDIYRAGDGCHIEFLKKRWPYLSFLRKISILINPFHIATLLIEKNIFTKTKKFIAISKMGKREIMTHYKVLEKNIHVIYNGVDFEKFKPNSEARKKIRNELNLKDNDFVLLFAGSGFKRKGLDFLLNSLPLIDRKNLQLIIAGYDKQLNKYKEKTRKLQIEQQVHFLNSTNAIENTFAASDLLIMPTIYEPFGNVCLEALASGIPALVSKTAGAHEVIQENYNGFIIENINDPSEIAEKIKKIMDNISFFKQNARSSIESYTLEKNAEETINLYEELVNQ